MLLRPGSHSVVVLLFAMCGVVLAYASAGVAHAQSLEKSLEAYDFEEYQDAATWLRPHAEGGHAEAQYRMGKMCESGKGLEKSVAEAKRWYQKAATQGHVGARRRLEALEGKPARANDDSVAVSWYQDKADAGDPDAQYNLGYMYETGFSVPRDNGRAAQWYERAAEKRNIPAQVRLGLMYLAGAGVKQSEIQAAKWLGLAAERGNALAKAVMEQMLEKNTDLALDKPVIAERVRGASLKDDNRGIASLTVLIQEARAKFEREKAVHQQAEAKRKSIESAMLQQTTVEFGLDEQGRRTVAWYRHNAERGSAMAQFQLGKIYESGVEVQLDLAEAARWIGASAQQGYPDAQYYLGMMYFYGVGVEKDVVLGESLIKAAAGQDHAQAKRAVKLISSSPSLAQFSAAAWWLTRSGQEQNGPAMQHAGSLYQQGRGVPVDNALGQTLTNTGLELRSLRDVDAARISAPGPAAETKVAEPAAVAAPRKATKIVSATEESNEVHAEGDEPASRTSTLTLFLLFAALPIAAFGWFYSKEKKRPAAGVAAAGAKGKKPAARSQAPAVKRPAPRPRRSPDNPFG